MPRKLIHWSQREETPRERSKKQEKRAARMNGGRVQPASGALDFYKGDVDLGAYLLECKTTQRLSFSVTRELLKKISDEARVVGKKPGFMVSFENGMMKAEDWILIRVSDFKGLLEK